MRASVLALGPLLARFGHAKVSLPGGCAIGSRPVDQHIKGLQAMGAIITVENGYMQASLPEGRKRLKGRTHHHRHGDRDRYRELPDGRCAGRRRDGAGKCRHGARNHRSGRDADQDGAQITGHGTSHIVIQGVDKLHGCEHQVVADRIEAGTFLCAVAATSGEALLHHARADHLGAVIDKLKDAGVSVDCVDGGLKVASSGKLKAQGFRTTEYPGFPTDMQAQFMALNLVAEGTSMVTETIFENRFMHVNEMVRLGARITTDGRVATIEGGKRLSGATVMATDLRASASLVIAGLVAEGETIVDRIYHLDRGYDRMEDKLRALGADIERISA